MDRERNLLFGVFAVQLCKVTPTQLLAAAGAWAVDPSIGLPERLLQDGVLSREDLGLLVRLVNEAIDAHKGNATATLESFVGSSTIQATFGPLFATIGIPEISSTPTPDPMRTPVQYLGESSVPGVQETPGRYTHVSEYGRGGMGRVLLVHDAFLARDVALKELLPVASRTGDTERASTPVRRYMAFLSRFLQEARITGQLEHPSIVPVYELGHRRDGTLYYTMKLVRGNTLRHAIKACSSLADRLNLLPHFLDLCQAIAYAHSRGIIHRDLKPDNVMVGEFGETVVLDWGLAKAKNKEDVHADELAETIRMLNLDDIRDMPQTHDGEILGTPAYMPPEQARGELDRIDERSDVYSLGVVLYELLAGSPPFRGKTVQEILRRVLQEEAPPLSKTDTPPELAAICSKAMHKDPDQRFRSALKLAEEVQRYQTGAMVSSYRYGATEILKLFYRKHRAAVHVGAVAALAALCVAVFSFIQVYEARNRERDQRVLAEVARDTAEQAKQDAQTARDQAVRQATLARTRLLQAYVNERNFSRANPLLWSIEENQRDWEWGYLLNACNEDLFTIRGHESILFSIEYSANGQTVLTLAGDHTARVCRAADGAPVATIRVPHALITDGVLSQDGSKVLLALRDSTARIFDAGTGSELSAFQGHTGAVNTARFFLNDTRIVTSSTDRSVRVWDTATRQQLLELNRHADDVIAAFAEPEGRYLVSSTRDGILYVWRYGDVAPLRMMSGTLPVFDPSGTKVAFLQAGTAVVWNMAEDREEVRFETESKGAKRVRFSPRGTFVATGSTDGVARIYDANSGTLRVSCNHGEDVKDVHISSDEQVALATSAAGMVTVWDIPSGRRINRLVGHEAALASAVFSPDGENIATASMDHTAKIWDARHARGTIPIFESEKPVNAVIASSDGSRIGLACQDQSVRLFDASTFQQAFAHLAYSEFGPPCLAFSSDSARVAVPLDGVSVFVLDTQTGEVVSRYMDHRGDVRSVAYSPAGTWVLSGGDDAVGHIWDPRDGTQRILLEGHEGRIHGVAVSPDGLLAATASADHSVCIWDATSGALRYQLSGHTADVNSVSFSPDGLHLISAGKDGVIMLWSTISGEREGTLTGHAEEVAGAVYSPDGHRIVSTSQDRTIRVWNPLSAEELVLLPHDGADALSVCFSANGMDVLSGDRSGQALAYRSAPWRQDQVEDLVGNSFQERFEQYKRALERRVNPVQADVEERIVHTTPERLRTHLALLRLALDTPVEQPAETVAGLAMEPGVRANAMLRLCLQPGDIVTSLDGEPLTGIAEAKEALDEAIQSTSGAESVRIELVRAGQTLRYTWKLHELVEKQTRVELSREEAREMINFVAYSLTAGRETLLQVNQFSNTRLGFPPESRTELNGFWLPRGGPRETTQVYRRLGVSENDRIVRVNGEELHDLDQVTALAGQAMRALDGPESHRIEVVIDRGEFQRITLLVEVR